MSCHSASSKRCNACKFLIVLGVRSELDFCLPGSELAWPAAACLPVYATFSATSFCCPSLSTFHFHFAAQTGASCHSSLSRKGRKHRVTKPHPTQRLRCPFMNYILHTKHSNTPEGWMIPDCLFCAQSMCMWLKYELMSGRELVDTHITCYITKPFNPHHDHQHLHIYLLANKFVNAAATSWK